MCGVVGYYGDGNNEDRKIIKRLFTESLVRGLHSFGVAFGVGLVFKFFNKNDLIDSIEEISFNSCIIHNRYSTSGDWKDHINNQPVFVNGVCLVFNGVISQKDKSGMQKEFSLRMETENDGELFCHLGPEVLKKKGVSFAGLWYGKDGKLFFARNEFRPLYYAKKNDSVFIASTKDIFKRVCAFMPRVVIPNKIYNSGMI